MFYSHIRTRNRRKFGIRNSEFGIVGRGSPVETFAAGKSADRVGRRDTPRKARCVRDASNVLLRNVKYLLRKCEMAAPRYIGFANVKCASHIAGRRLRRCVKCVTVRFCFYRKRLQLCSLADDRVRNRKSAADTIYPLSASDRSRRGAGCRIAVRKAATAIPNSAFRIPNSLRLRIVRAAAQNVGLLCGKPRPQFRIPNSEFRIELF